MKELMTNNYPATCMAIGGAVMSLGYSLINEKVSSCPVVLLTGDTETGKSTALRCCMALFSEKTVRGNKKTYVQCVLLFLKVDCGEHKVFTITAHCQCF